jgi:hypothetical protein
MHYDFLCINCKSEIYTTFQQVCMDRFPTLRYETIDHRIASKTLHHFSKIRDATLFSHSQRLCVAPQTDTISQAAFPHFP